MERTSKIHKHSIEQPTDRLSALPDSLLLHILSFLYMWDVVPTSFLSKRWRNLWKSVPVMDFHRLWPTLVHLSVNFVERSLALREGSKIRKFRIFIEIDTYPYERVDLWVSIVVRHNLEELHLELFTSGEDELDLNVDYRTPHCIYNCTSLVSLTMSCCKIDMPASAGLSSLNNLYLDRVDLTDDILRALISACPPLKHLTLSECNRCKDLNIFAEKSRLKSLKIIERDFDELNIKDTKLGIYAPSLLSVDFVNCMPRRSYEVKNLSSLVVASFILDEDMCKDYYCTANFVELLDQISHVKLLRIHGGCVVELSIREIRGSSTEVFFSVSTLVLETSICKYELPGLVYMLRSFTKLEVLIIDVVEEDESLKAEEKFQGCEFDEIRSWKSLETCFSDKSEHIKTIEIRGIFMGSECATEKIEAAAIGDVEKQRNMIMQKTKEEMVECILKGNGNMIRFIKILVENSAELEKFTITTRHQWCYANLVFTRQLYPDLQ